MHFFLTIQRRVRTNWVTSKATLLSSYINSKLRYYQFGSTFISTINLPKWIYSHINGVVMSIIDVLAISMDMQEGKTQLTHIPSK